MYVGSCSARNNRYGLHARSTQQSGQEQDNVGEQGNDDDHCQFTDKVWYNTLEDLRGVDTQRICSSKYVHANGRRQAGDLAHEAQADDENIGAVAHGIEHGEHHGYGDDDNGNDVHNAATEDVQQYHQHKDEECRCMDGSDQAGQRICQLGGGDKGAEQLTGNDDGEDAGLHGGRLPNAVGDLLQGQTLYKGVNAHGKCADGAADGCSEQTGKGTADDDAEQAQDRDQEPQALEFLLDRKSVV